KAAIAQIRLAPFRADDTGSDGFTDPQWIADGKANVAHAHLIGIAERKHGQLRGADLQHREIAGFIGSHDFRLEVPPIHQIDADLLSAVNDVIVRQYVPVFPNDHARTEGGLLLHGRLSAAAEPIWAAPAEKPVEKGIALKIELLGRAHAGSRMHGHHRGRDAVDRVRVRHDIALRRDVPGYRLRRLHSASGGATVIALAVVALAEP